jgi:TonB family protein
MKPGRVDIEFAIAHDGKLQDIRLFRSSGDMSLDRAAWGGITATSPFPALPDAYKGDHLALRIHFLYNCKGQDCPGSDDKLLPGTYSMLPLSKGLHLSPTEVELAEGEQRKFNLTESGKSLMVAIWNVAGNGCKQDACGTVSPTGVYTAPRTIPDPPTVTIMATSIADPGKTASATVTIVKASSSH